MSDTKRDDLTFGDDVRGDYALFIEEKHFITSWDIDSEAAEAAGSGATFFRVIQDGVEKHSHGWIEDGKVVQWG